MMPDMTRRNAGRSYAERVGIYRERRGRSTLGRVGRLEADVSYVGSIDGDWDQICLSVVCGTSLSMMSHPAMRVVFVRSRACGGPPR